MGHEADLGPRLSGRLQFLLKSAWHELEAHHEEALAPLGIDSRELGVLLFLDGREPESQQQAAQHLGLDRTTMVGLLDRLEAKRLVTRRPDAADRRRNVVELTDAGRLTLRRAVRASDAAEAALLADISDTEAVHLRDLLHRLAFGTD